MRFLFSGQPELDEDTPIFVNEAGAYDKYCQFVGCAKKEGAATLPFPMAMADLAANGPSPSGLMAPSKID